MLFGTICFHLRALQAAQNRHIQIFKLSDTNQRRRKIIGGKTLTNNSARKRGSIFPLSYLFLVVSIRLCLQSTHTHTEKLTFGARNEWKHIVCQRFFLFSMSCAIFFCLIHSRFLSLHHHHSTTSNGLCRRRRRNQRLQVKKEHWRFFLASRAWLEEHFKRAYLKSLKLFKFCNKKKLKIKKIQKIRHF